VHGRLDSDADLAVDQFAQRDRLKLMPCDRLPDTFAHGAFLRWPPCHAARWSLTSRPEECAISLFHTTWDAANEFKTGY
jgi:hypothetical protein